MTVDLSPETWAQVRHEYEHTDKPVEDICADHGISSGTLRDRMRRWRWTRRRPPIAAEGPPPTASLEPAAPLAAAMTCIDAAPPVSVGETPSGMAALPAALAGDGPLDPAEIAPRLQGAVARVLPAIDAIIAKLAAGPMHPRETERAARTLTALTRTLRELNELLRQYPARENRGPEDPDEFALMLIRRLNAFKAARAEEAASSDQKEKERG